MAWQVIDFQGIASLDKGIVPQVQNYLEEKETTLCQTILTTMSMATESSKPELEGGTKQKLSDGVEIFARKLSLKEKGILPPWHVLVASIESAIWEYIEVLEGASVELFQQLDQISLDQWRTELRTSVESIKNFLLHSMEDLKWSLMRLESSLRHYRKTTGESDLGYTSWWRSLMPEEAIFDKAIDENLQKSQKFLNFNYQKFLQRFEQYELLNNEVEQSLEHFQEFYVLSLLEIETQKQFKALYRLLKLWERNQRIKALPQEEVVAILQLTISPAQAFQLFKDYKVVLEKKLFEQSRALKNGAFEDPLQQKELQKKLLIQQKEVHTLDMTIDKYRQFLLKSNSDPYVRSLGGLAEWMGSGELPMENKALLKQEYDVEMLDSFYQEMISTVNRERPLEIDNKLHQEIQHNLHDMGQPLASHSMMSQRAQRFVDHLQQFEELGSHDPKLIDQITYYFSKAMRADWKYHTLQEIASFHRLYAIHLGVTGPSQERKHLNRWHKFHQLTQQIHNWIKDKKVISHLHEIEIDMNDIKGYLQDFLATTQRCLKNITTAPSTGGIAQASAKEIALQLLEYRYLFSCFFHNLREEDTEERLIRHRLLFVDHYFEAVENLLVQLMRHQGCSSGS